MTKSKNRLLGELGRSDDLEDLANLDVPATTTITAFAATLLDDAHASDARTTLGAQAQSSILDNTTASFTTTKETKLAGIEDNATADQTASEIRTLVESATDSNVFTDADHTKLNGIETNATADQTDAEIRAAVEAATDSNVFTDADHTKLNAIEASADVTDATNVQAAGAVMDSELTDETAVKAIDQGLATTDSPTFVNATTTGEVNVGTHIDLAVQNAHASFQEGRIWYDNIHKTVNFYSDNQNVIHEVGLEEHQRVYNSTGSTIAKGKPLYFAGNYTAGTIDVPTVGLADATDVNAYNAQGLAAADIPNNSYGYCIIAGQLDGLDTSGLTAGTNFFVGLTPGAVQNASPVYPNYPMCLGWVVNSDSTNGVLLVNQQNHSVNSFRVRTDAHIGDDLIVGGNLSVLGTTTTTSTSDVTAGAPFYRANEGDAIGDANTTFSGTGLDDAFFAGHFTGTTSTTYYVKIDSVGTPDTFSVSTDNFVTTISTGNAITGNEQMIHSADNISVKFGATTGHTLNDTWTGVASPVLVDSGFFTNRNTGTSGVGYTHMGLFYDVSTDKWTLLDEYDPVPSGTINLSDASTSYGLLKLDTVEGDLTGDVTGNVSGNATTATTLASSRSIGLGGELSGSASFDGSADITISSTVADNVIDEANLKVSNSPTDGYYLQAQSGNTGGMTWAAVPPGYADSDVDTHLNTSTANSGEYLSWNGTDYDWATVPAGYADSDVDTHLNRSSAGTNQILSWNGSDYAWVDDSNTTYSIQDGELSEINFTSADHTKLNGIEAGATADQTASEILTAIKTVDGPGSGLDADTLDGNEASAFLTAHPNISAASSSNNSGSTFIQDITLDSNGHVTGIATATASSGGSGAAYVDTATGNYGTVKVDDDRGVSWAGYAIRDDWVLMSDGASNCGIYNDTDNEWGLLCRRNAEVELYHNGSVKLETASDGITVSGNVDVSGQVEIGGEVILKESSDRADLLEITSSTSGWGGLQIRNSSDEGRWSFMTDGAVAGIYDDQNAHWQIQFSENGYTSLYNDNVEQLRTLTGGVGVTGLTVGSLSANPHNSGGLNVSNSANEKIVLSGSNDPYIRWQEGTTDRAYIQWSAGQDALLFRNQQTDNFDFMPDSSTGAVNLRLRGSDNDTWGSVYATDSQEVGFLDEGGSWAYRISNDSYQRWYVAGSEKMRLESDADLHVDGDIIAYSTTISDVKLKKDIEPIENALEKVKKLNGYTFTYKKDDKKSAGVIAQEVEKVLPSAVSEKVSVFHGEEDEAHKVVQYDQLHGLLIEAIKEQQKQIDELKKELAK